MSDYFFVPHFHTSKITQKEAEAADAILQVRPRPCGEQRHVLAMAGTATCSGHRPRQAGHWPLGTAVTGPFPRSILCAGLGPARAARDCFVGSSLCVFVYSEKSRGTNLVCEVV